PSRDRTAPGDKGCWHRVDHRAQRRGSSWRTRDRGQRSRARQPLHPGAAEGASLMKARILLVEDEPSMRRALIDILESEGYRVQIAPDGEAGLQHAAEQQPDVILLDVMLPKLDGF